jgi:hypothetical protein
MKTKIGLAVLATALMTAPAMARGGGGHALNVAGISVGAGALTGHNGVLGLLTGHGAVGVTTGKSGILGAVLGRGGTLGGLLGGGCGCR